MRAPQHLRVLVDRRKILDRDRAGTRGSDGSITNDMEINSKSDFRWVINAVWVRTALDQAPAAGT
ncbi:hypothetical protein AB0J82_23200 [Asanoa sp. NPDC049518]|uniref:hypothetical protein n=1 Tax=unclassified Asanoa TaxID=2685164 RepID=UPI00344040FB